MYMYVHQKNYKNKEFSPSHFGEIQYGQKPCIIVHWDFGPILEQLKNLNLIRIDSKTSTCNSNILALLLIFLFFLLFTTETL